MELSEEMLKDGLKLIVGTWRVDYLVNAFSDDLAHIPATEFKSEDGTDFTAISYEFFEDHTMVMKNASNGVESKGTWEQTDMFDYHYTVGDFFDIPDSVFKKNAETLSVQDGYIVFSIGFLAVAMKKIAEGVVTKAPDIGDIEMTTEDLSNLGIVGKYQAEKVFSFIDGDMGLFSREQVQADVDKQLAAEMIDERDAQQQMRAFDNITEFCTDHKVRTWMKVPDGMKQSEIDAALQAGEISAYKDGYACIGEQDWKCIGGKFYIDSGEHRESFGEVQSSWDEIKFDEDGLMDFQSGMCKLKKI
ncbi:MAG: hypothetical protein IKR78_00365 [Dehalococcoidales bacterium]|nr:hypothetical protein [Dehalococcoidales bacterium]